MLWKTFDAFINRLGFMFTSLGIYFIFRILINSFSDIDRLIKTLIIMSIPVMLAMILEQINGRNMFSIFGGVPEFTFVRDGRLRSQGAFSHPILAGSYGAALVPLSYCIWVMGNKKYAISGFVVGTIMVITSASSGPLLSFLAGILGLLMWHFRNYMRIIVWLFISNIIT